MKKLIIYAVSVLICFLLQCSFFDYFTMADVVPNLLIIMTASIAILEGPAAGCIAGFACGLLLDLTFGSVLGLYGLGYLLTGFLTGYTNRLFYKEDIALPLVTIVAADILVNLYTFVIGFLIRGRLSLWFYFRRIILPEAAYTLIAALFIYRLCLFIWRRMQHKGSGNFIV